MQRLDAAAGIVNPNDLASRSRSKARLHLCVPVG
jgi:hypothetical protein